MLWLLKVAAFFNRATTVISDKADVLQQKTVNRTVDTLSQRFSDGEQQLRADVQRAADHYRYMQRRQRDEFGRLAEKFHNGVAKVTAIAAKGAAK